MKLAQVIINRPAKQLDRAFSYALPSNELIAVGTRVRVPLGNQQEEGFVVGYEEVDPSSLTYTVKPIRAVLDPEPWFTEEMLATSEKIATYYLCARSESLSLFTIDKKKNKTYERPKEEWIFVDEGLSLEDIPARCKKQRELFQYIKEHGPTSKTLLKEKGFSLLVIRAFLDYEGTRTESFYKETRKAFDKEASEQAIALNEEQTVAMDAIGKALEEKKAESFLLHGVTGSGKTFVYLEATKRCVEQGRICLVLVPEIVMTHQIVQRFVEYFGEEVVVFHSQLTKEERYNNWERLRRKDSHICIGARSAIFAPVDDLGLIIIDEEHATSYKQEDMVRYDARKVAQWRSENHSCPLILGSATPSIESYYKAEQGEYHYLSLKERYQARQLPSVLLVDMKEELLHGNYSVFSDALTDLLTATFAKKEQAIVLLNRRGFSTFILCRDCGEAIQCPHCATAMVYHKADDLLRCHYCDHTEPIPTECPHCGSKRIKFFGSGTQKVEEELHKHFPNVRIARLDQDVASKKGEAARILEDFQKREYDLLLGTQMVAKGLDLPGVTAVGVLTADSSLNIPKYTAAERTFDLLTQVAGRAGRGEGLGRVVIQSYNPLHYAIIKSKTHDYLGFYQDEVAYRRALQFPPFGRLIHLEFRLEDKEELEAITARAEKFLRPLCEKAGLILYGPYEESVSKIRDKYRQSFLIRGEVDDEVKSAIRHSWLFTAKGLYIDVDPI